MAGFMNCRPVNQFCCGCSLQFGVRLILLAHLLMSLFYIATAVSNIIMQVPTFGYSVNLATQTFNSAFALIGLPLIAAAWYGVSYRLEQNVRLYLWYMLISFIIDLGYTVVFLVIQDSCGMLPTVLRRHGAAFACGFTRILTFMFITLLTIIQGYFMYVVWSFAEDIRAGGAGCGFPELLQAAAESKHRHKSGAYHDGLFGTGFVSDNGPFPVHYGSINSHGVGGGSRIFGGSFHDTNFPPRL